MSLQSLRTRLSDTLPKPSRTEPPAGDRVLTYTSSQWTFVQTTSTTKPGSHMGARDPCSGPMFVQQALYRLSCSLGPGRCPPSPRIHSHLHPSCHFYLSAFVSIQEHTSAEAQRQAMNVCIQCVSGPVNMHSSSPSHIQPLPHSAPPVLSSTHNQPLPHSAPPTLSSTHTQPLLLTSPPTFTVPPPTFTVPPTLSSTHNQLYPRSRSHPLSCSAPALTPQHAGTINCMRHIFPASQPRYCFL